ncbi:MAG: PorV/PorQ family protein [Bacteroidota bacterium]
MKRLGKTLVFLFFGFACSGQVAKFSNDFLSIGVGARAQAMGNVQVSIVDDVTAGFWNPAGLSRIEGTFQIGVKHAEWFAGIGQYDYLAVAKPIRFSELNRTIGVSFIRFAIDDIPNTLDLIEADGSINFDNISGFTAGDYAGIVSYAQDTHIEGLSIGGSVKVIHRRAGKFAQSWGFGVDLGLTYQTGNWFFGLSGKDITSTFNAWSFNFSEADQATLAITGNEVPDNSIEITTPRVILGAGYRARLAKQISVLVATDLSFTTDGQRNVLINSSFLNIDPAFGMEIAYKDFVFVRGGINNFQKAISGPNVGNQTITAQPNLGAGVKFNRIRLDYALTDVGDVSQVLYSHIFSIILDLKLSRRKQASRGPGIPERIIEQID